MSAQNPSPPSIGGSTVLDGIPAVLWEYAPERDLFPYVNEGAERTTGHAKRRWLEEPGFFASIVHPEDRAYAMETCMTANTPPAGLIHDYRLLGAAGEVLWVRHAQIIYANTAAQRELGLADVPCTGLATSRWWWSLAGARAATRSSSAG